MAGDDGHKEHAWICDGIQVYQYGKEVSAIMLFPIGKSGIMGETCYYAGRINQYTTDYYHRIWGWDDINDGWFANSNIPYKNNRKDIVNIAPVQ